MILVPLLNPKFAIDLPQSGANFGFGALAMVLVRLRSVRAGTLRQLIEQRWARCGVQGPRFGIRRKLSEE